MKEPSFWDKWEWARAHQKPAPKLVLNNSGASVAPPAMAPLNAPRFSEIKSLDEPIIIDATGAPPEKTWGDTARDLAASTGRQMVKLGSALEDNGSVGEMGGKAYLRTHRRPYLQHIPSGARLPVPTMVDAWIGASQVIGNAGSVIRGMGAGLLSWGTDNSRPLLDAGMSINTGRHAPLPLRPLIDDAFKTGIDRTYGRDQI
jgi:hypothetical protein